MSQTTKLGRRMPISITTITPLHIGGSETLSPLADYWMDAQKNICLVDTALLAESIYSAGQTENYINAVKQVAIERKGNLLPNFAKGNLAREMTGLLSGKKMKGYGIYNPVEIDCCIKTDDLPYLPGSTIKGAIRNMLLQHWLLGNDKKARQALEAFVEALAGFVRRSDLNKKKQMAEIEKIFTTKAEEEFFGSLKQEERLAASCLRVNDTAPAAWERLAVYQLDRHNLLTGETAIPVLKECIEKNTTFTTTLSLDYYEYTKQQLHPIFRPIETLPQLFQLVNTCTQNILQYEYQLLRNEYVQSHRLREYEEFMHGLLKKINDTGKNKAYLRLGFGKMQFYQTIALPLFKYLGEDEDQPDWVQYLAYCDSLSEDISAVYPATRVLTTAGQLPLGWVEITAA